MRHLLELPGLLLNEKLVAVVDATLLCLGLTTSVAALVPTLEALARGLGRMTPLQGD